MPATVRSRRATPDRSTLSLPSGGLAAPLLAPFVAVVAPVRAGRMLRGCGWFAAILVALLAAAVIGTINGLGIWVYVEFEDWQYSNWNSIVPHTQMQNFLAYKLPLRRSDYIAAGMAAVGGTVGYAGVLLAGGFVGLHRTSRADGLAATFRRSLLAVGGATVLLGWAVALVTVLVLIYRLNAVFGAWPVEPVAAVLAVPLSSLLFLRAVKGIADGLCPPAPEDDDTPTCEGCGYDLTGRDWSQRCTECGRSVGSSLNPQRVRPGTPWARRKRLWQSVEEALFGPGAFYGTLRTRRGLEKGDRFARRVQVMLLLGGMLAMGLYLLVMSAVRGGILMQGVEMVLLVTGGALWALVLCQWAHGLVASAAVLMTRYTCRVPDDRWLAHASCYEWSFAWPLAMFWGLTFAMVTIFEGPLTRLLGFVFGVPADVAWLFGGTSALGFVWLYRYQRIARAIRWSNF